MKNIFKIGFYIALMYVSSYAGNFTAIDNTISYSIDANQSMNLKMELSGEPKICLTELRLLDDDNEIILKAEHMLKKGNITFNAPVKKGNYTLKYRTLSLCGNVNYNIKITKVIGNFEEELNDTISSATSLNGIDYIYGYLQRWNDKDNYKLEVRKDSTVRLVFEHEYINTFFGFKINVFDVNNKQVTSFKSSAKSTKEVKKINLSKGTYYIQVLKQNTSSKVQYYRYKLSY